MSRSSKYSIEYLEEVQSAYIRHGTKVKAAQALGITYNKIKYLLELAEREIPKVKGTTIKELNERILQLESELATVKEDPTSLLNRDREIAKLKSDNNRINAKLKESEKEVERLYIQSEILSSLDDRTLQTFDIRPKHDKAEATAFLVASDWHIEEPVDPETIGGYNEFNLEIAEERAINFFKNGLYLIKKEKQSAKIDNVVLALIGDFITNYIHPELEEDALLSPTMAIDMAERLLASGIRFLLNDGCFENLLIPCCFGNHGRTTAKSRYATGWKNNYEVLMYMHLARYFENEDRVNFNITKGYHNIITVYDRVVRLHHGDGIKYGGGVGGISVPVNKAIARWNDKEHATLDVFGHFHQLHFSKSFVSNGSLIGYNAYAERFGCSPEPAQQAFFLIDKDHGRTTCAPVFVTE
jgi:hypothetical protein